MTAQGERALDKINSGAEPHHKKVTEALKKTGEAIEGMGKQADRLTDVAVKADEHTRHNSRKIEGSDHQRTNHQNLIQSPS